VGNGRKEEEEEKKRRMFVGLHAVRSFFFIAV
jgi:hypothetical protein